MPKTSTKKKEKLPQLSPEDDLLRQRGAAVVLAVLEKKAMSKCMNRMASDEEENAFVALQMIHLREQAAKKAGNKLDEPTEFTVLMGNLMDLGMPHKPDFKPEPGRTPRDNTAAAWHYLQTGERTGAILDSLGPLTGPPRPMWDLGVQEMVELMKGSGRIDINKKGGEHLVAMAKAEEVKGSKLDPDEMMSMFTKATGMDTDALLGYPKLLPGKPLTIDCRVVLHDLKAQPQLNGHLGTVKGKTSNGRVAVELRDGKTLSLKPANLTVAMCAHCTLYCVLPSHIRLH